MKFYTETHREFQRTMRRIVDEDINPFVAEWERAGIFPAHELFKKLGNAGLLGITRPAAFGGLGLDFGYTAAVVEALGHVRCGAIPMAIGVHTDMATPALAAYGSDELRQDYLAPAISGDFVSCLGVSEPEAGSDVAALRTTARRDGGDFVINGEKMWITNSLQADFMVALVNTGDDANIHRNKSLIVIPMDLPGITKNKIEKMGMHASDTGHIFFDDVRVPARNVIGEVGRGFTYQMEQFQEERLWACIIGITQMQNVLDETIEYTRQRKIFGQSVLDNQVVHYKLAEIETEIEFFRIAVTEALDRYMAGEDTLKLLSMVKLKLGRLNRLVTDGCVQFWGGMGFANGSLASQFYRDARLGSIGGGADEVMLRIIAKTMGILAERRAR